MALSHTCTDNCGAGTEDGGCACFLKLHSNSAHRYPVLVDEEAILPPKCGMKKGTEDRNKPAEPALPQA